MKTYKITFYAHNKKYLTRILSYINPTINKNIKLLKSKKIIKKFTILKSPHINKKAQEQFSYTIFSKQILIYSQNHLYQILFLQKYKLHLFNNLKILIKINSFKNKLTQKKIDFFKIIFVRLHNFYNCTNKKSIKKENSITTHKTPKYNQLKKLEKLFKLLDGIET